MKKAPFLLLSILLFSQAVYSQTAYYDALALRADVRFTTDSSQKPPVSTPTHSFISLSAALQILQFYTDSMSTGIPYTSTDNITAAFANNPFIGAYLPIRVKQVIGSPQYLQSVINSAGNSNVTSFADGLAKLIVSRVKTDLNTYFFQKLQDFLTNKCPELQVLFPHTLLVINTFASTEYSNILNTLREAFDKDLHNLLATIPKLPTLQYTGKDTTVIHRIAQLKHFFSSNDGKIFLSGIAVGNGFIAGEKFPDIIDTLTTIYLSGWTDTSSASQVNARSTIQLLSILNHSLRSNVQGVSYVAPADLEALLKDTLATKFYLGLLWQQVSNRQLTINQTNIADLIKPSAGNMAVYLDNLLKNGTGLSAAIQALQNAKAKGQTDLSAYYAAIFESSTQLLTTAQNIETLFPGSVLPPSVKTIFTYGSDITEIAHDMAVKNYNAAIVGLLKYISDIIPADTSSSFSTAVQHFVKYASFAANVVSATSSDDVQNAIEAIALPAGSSVMQRNTYFNISINAYGGGFFGNEYMPALKTQRYSWSGGVTAPVGFAFTFGNIGRSSNLKNANGKSLTLFIPLIDVGALAAFRFQNDSSNAAANVQLKNIIAPGAFLYFGLGKCPLSVGVGAQVGPQLRSITATDINTDKNFYVRFGLNVLFDIPLFNLYSDARQSNKSVFTR